LRAGQIIRRRASSWRAAGERRVEASKLVEEASALALVGAKDQAFGCDFSSTHHRPILADKVQIQQVLLNLLRNAVEAWVLAKA
jgi:two-component system sensor kinase FixL